MKIQDQEIVDQLKKSNINAPVHYLYQEYFSEITKLISFNGGTEDDGADIFQETVLTFIDLVKTDRYRGDSSIKTFLYAIAKNLWRQELRSRGRRNNRETLYSSGEEKISYDSEDFFVDKDMRHTMDAIYKEIGDTCRNILKGFYYEDLSMKELLTRFNYENEQVLRNKKSICMKKIKDVLHQNKNLLSTFKNLLFYGK